MLFKIEERPSDSPFVERVWRSHSESDGDFISIAECRWEMVVTKLQGKLTLTLRGPETKATRVRCPADGEWVGIRFKVGTVMPHLPASKLVDRDLNLPDASSKSFWLQGSAWQFPNYENADTFVNRLVREGLAVRDRIVEAALQLQLDEQSIRTARRHFRQTAGLTQIGVRQIERARYAAMLLREGISIGDVVFRAGFVDQPHLTKSLRYFIGLTPAQIRDRNSTEQLSFLYKTEPFP